MVLYIIKGFHYSTFFPKIYRFRSENKKSVQVKFDKSCAYKIDEKSCVNKLWGFSVGLFGVHKNSYRFGWTYENDKIIIWTYSYINGKLQKEMALLSMDGYNDYKKGVQEDDRFLMDWCYASGEEIEHFSDFYLQEPYTLGDKAIQIVTSGPDHNEEYIKNALFKLINNT